MAGSVEVRQRRNRPRKRPVTTCNGKDIDVSTIDLTDLSHLKEVSQRLNLSTRRPSTIQWKQVIELRKSMGLYGSSGDVDGTACGDFEVGNGIVAPSRPYSLFVPQQSSSTPASGDDDITKCITRSRGVKNDEKSVDVNATSKSQAALQRNSRNQLLAQDNLQCGKTGEELRDMDLHSRQTELPDGQNHFDKMQLQDIDSAHLSNPQTDIESRTVRNSLRIFCEADDEIDDNPTSGISDRNVRYYTITKTLRKLRRDLITMRIQDNRLARHLLETRNHMNILKLTQSCDKHAEMLDDVAYELEEEDMLTGLIKACDLPSRPPESILSAFSPLRNIGVSRMNLNRRRFSIR